MENHIDASVFQRLYLFLRSIKGRQLKAERAFAQAVCGIGDIVCNNTGQRGGFRIQGTDPGVVDQKANPNIPVLGKPCLFLPGKDGNRLGG